MARTVCMVMIAMLFVSCKSYTVMEVVDYNSEITTEWNDGYLWAYKDNGGHVVGITNYEASDDFGSYYQIVVLVQNNSGRAIDFDPANVSAWIGSGNEYEKLEVYTHEEYQKRAKRKRNWAVISYGVLTGLGAAASGYETTYTRHGIHTTYNPWKSAMASAIAASSTYAFASSLDNSRRAAEEGYLKKHTIYPGEYIVGYMNIGKKGGKNKIIHVDIPIAGRVFDFDWYIRKVKK